jgi:hypothetical protein
MDKKISMLVDLSVRRHAVFGAAEDVFGIAKAIH